MLTEGERVVAQLGIGAADAQVLVLDLRTRQVAVLALGQGPVVMMEPK